MTEREQLTTRGNYFNRTGDYRACVKEYGHLWTCTRLTRVAHNQRMICLARLRDMRAAVDEMRILVKDPARPEEFSIEPGALFELRGRVRGE